MLGRGKVKQVRNKIFYKTFWWRWRTPATNVFVLRLLFVSITKTFIFILLQKKQKLKIKNNWKTYKKVIITDNKLSFKLKKEKNLKVLYKYINISSKKIINPKIASHKVIVNTVQSYQNDWSRSTFFALKLTHCPKLTKLTNKLKPKIIPNRNLNIVKWELEEWDIC